MKAFIAAAGICAALFPTPPALAACGHCMEDRIAAVYDPAVVAKAQARHHRMAWFAIEGRLPAHGARQVVAAALAPVRGIDVLSVRVSPASAALSLSYDGKRTTPARIQESVNRRLAARGLSVSLLRGP